MVSAVKEQKVAGSHRAVIDTLARDLEMPIDEVESVYLSEITKIEQGARIKTFVSVLAAGNVRTQLRGARDASRRPAARIRQDAR